MNHYVYLLTHLESKEFYYGSRTCKCNPEDDKEYLGSMITWKPDKTKLIKTILKSDFISRSEALKYEAKVIKENIKNPLNRNYYIPGIGFCTEGISIVKDENGRIFCVSCEDFKSSKGKLSGVAKNTVVVKDKENNIFRILKSDPRYLSKEVESIQKEMFSAKDTKGNVFRITNTDPRYLSKELISITKGSLTVKDENGKTSRVSVDNADYLTGKLVPLTKGQVTVRDKEGNCFNVSLDDERYQSGELISNMKGRISVKDKEGNNLKVSVIDPRYLSGELVHTCVNKPRTEETKQKLSKSRLGKFNGSDSPRFGSVWIFNKILKETKVIHKDFLDKYLEEGWEKGRRMKF